MKNHTKAALLGLALFLSQVHAQTAQSPPPSPSGTDGLIVTTPAPTPTMDEVLQQMHIAPTGNPPVTGTTNFGNEGGGGGDATEMGVDEIRSDILKWVTDGGADGLTFTAPMDAKVYSAAMKKILAFQYVVIGFVTSVQEQNATDPEQQVIVNGVYKTCRGFISVHDQRPHILCNSDRYPKTGDEQYRLIHHEFAGLAGIEVNTGAASDYTYSKQVSEFLGPVWVMRLSLKKRGPSARYSGVLFSDSHKNPLGAMEIIFSPQPGPNAPAIRVAFSSGGRIFFVSPAKVTVDSATGSVQASLQLQDSTGLAKTLALNAQLGSRSLSGTLSILGEAEFGGSFTLAADGLPIGQVMASLPTPSLNSEIQAFASSTEFSDKTSLPARLSLKKKTLSEVDDFLDLLSPIHLVSFALNYASGTISMAATWDERDESVTGALTLTDRGTNVEFKLDCQIHRALVDTISCRHYNQVDGVVGITSGTADTSGVRPIGNPLAPPLSRTFKGTVDLALPNHRYRQISVTFVYAYHDEFAQLAARFFPSHPKPLNVIFNLSDFSPVPLRGRWDEASGKLDANDTNAPSTSGGSAWIPELHCTDFYFDKTTAPFKCIYSSNRSNPLTLSLRP